MLPCFAVIHFFGHRYKADDFWQCCGISKCTAVQFMLHIIWYMFISASFCHLLKTFLFAANSKQTSTGKTDVLQYISFYISYTKCSLTHPVYKTSCHNNDIKESCKTWFCPMFVSRKTWQSAARCFARSSARDVDIQRSPTGGHSPAHHLGANRPLRFPDRTPR